MRASLFGLYLPSSVEEVKNVVPPHLGDLTIDPKRGNGVCIWYKKNVRPIRFYHGAQGARDSLGHGQRAGEGESPGAHY